MLINLGVFLWPGGNTLASHVYVERNDLNPHFLSLNKEVEAKHYAATNSTSAINENESSRANEIAQAAIIGQSCYRLGPFTHEPDFERAQAVLFDSDVKFQTSTRASQTTKGYRVYLGPLYTQAEIDDIRVELKRKKVLDHFVKKEEDQTYTLSLGVYNSEVVANTAVVLFSDKLDDVKIKSEDLKLPESYWLHLVLDDNESIVQELSNTDWGATSVKLGRFECLQG